MPDGRPTSRCCSAERFKRPGTDTASCKNERVASPKCRKDGVRRTGKAEVEADADAEAFTRTRTRPRAFFMRQINAEARSRCPQHGLRGPPDF